MNNQIEQLKNTLEGLHKELKEIDTSTLFGVGDLVRLGNKIIGMYDQLRQLRMLEFGEMLQNCNSVLRTSILLDYINEMQKDYNLMVAMELFKDFVNYGKEEGTYKVVDTIEIADNCTVNFVKLVEELCYYDWDKLRVNIDVDDDRYVISIGLIEEPENSEDCVAIPVAFLLLDELFGEGRSNEGKSHLKEVRGGFIGQLINAKSLEEGLEKLATINLSVIKEEKQLFDLLDSFQLFEAFDLEGGSLTCYGKITDELKDVYGDIMKTFVDKVMECCGETNDKNNKTNIREIAVQVF